MSDVTLRTKSNGKIEVRWREPGGRRRGRTFTRRRDAVSFAAELRRKLEGGGLIQLDHETPTLEEWVETYWRVHAVPNLAPNTRNTYAAVWGNHIQPRLGGMRLRKITSGVISLSLVDPMRRAGCGDPVITKTLGMLGSVMGVAVVHDLLAANPVVPVRKPRQEMREAEPLWPDVIEEIRQLLPRRDATLVSVLAYAGLRPEEALALQWRDIRKDTLIVERAVAHGELRKSDRVKKHDRVVNLLGPVASDLKQHRLAAGRPGLRELVFPRPDGELWKDHDYRNWRRRVYTPAAKTAGAIDTRPYALRGSFVSLLIQEGRNVLYVAEQAGHTPETCLRHYARLFRDAPDVPIPAENAIRAARDYIQTRSHG